MRKNLPMTSCATASLTISEALRGNRHLRPLADTTSALRLHAMLEDGISDNYATRDLNSVLTVRASMLHQPFLTTNLSYSPLARIRGLLVNVLLRLLSVGVTIKDPFHDAVTAWRADGRDSELVRRYEQFDDDERARLATDVAAHCTTLTRALGEVPGGWMPRSAVRVSQRLGDGRVILRDVIDLMVGTTSATASVALFDVSTSPLNDGSEKIVRYHALVQALRSSIVPLRTSIFSTATGELRTFDVDYEFLAQSVHEVLAVVGELGRSA